MNESLKGREAAIEAAIMSDPGALGYPGAGLIRNCRVPSVVGCPDLVILPEQPPPHLVLVEAKAAPADEAACKVIGQLLMYYAGALTIGHLGLELYSKYAQETSACGPHRKSLRKLRGFRSKHPDSTEPLSAGASLQPNEIALYLALDDDPPPSLRPTLDALRRYHGVKMGLLIVRDGAVTVEVPAAG